MGDAGAYLRDTRVGLPSAAPGAARERAHRRQRFNELAPPEARSQPAILAGSALLARSVHLPADEAVRELCCSGKECSRLP